MEWANTILSSVGVFIAWNRISEPYVWTNFKADLNMVGCKCCKNKRAVYSKVSLDSFVNSAMNVEYVYLLLQGINTYLEKYDDSKVLSPTGIGRSNVLISQIKFKQNRKWNIAQG